MALTRLNNRSVSAVTALPSGIDIPAGAITSGDLPSGTLVQMVSSGETYITYATSSSTLGYTGFSVSITPKFATSKIVILASLMTHMNGATGGSKTTIVRDVSGSLTTVWGTSGNLAGWYNDTASANANLHFPYHYSFRDSPNTTSNIIYKVYHASYTGSTQLDFGNGSNYPMCLTAFEILN